MKYTTCVPVSIWTSCVHLCGLTRNRLYYTLCVDTFPIGRRKDEARWGEYRTKRMVLAGYEEHGLLG